MKMDRITVSAVLEKRVLKKDGSHPIKLRITSKGKRKYYGCPYSATEVEWRKINSESAKGKLRKIKNELGQWELEAQKVAGQISPFSFKEFEDQFMEKEESGDESELREDGIQKMYADYIQELEANEQIGTATNYRCAIRSLSKFKKKLQLEDITVALLKAYERWMEKQNKSKTTISMYVRTLRTIMNMAKANGVINEQEYPFGNRKYVPPTSSKVKKALSTGDIKKIFSFQAAPYSNMDKSRDFWIFSYLCNGINMMDIAHLRWKNIDKTTIIFERIKTKNTNRLHTQKVVVIRNKHIDHIISKWGTGNRKNVNSLVFDIISSTDSARRRKDKVTQFTNKIVNKWMKRMGEDLGFDFALTTYVARHSFATALNRKGAPLTVIKEMLGHTSIVTTQNYIASLELEEIKQYSGLLDDLID